MAAAASLLNDSSRSGNNVTAGNGREVSREDIQSVFAKAAELRALHASLSQGSPSPLPSRSTSSHFSPQDYPVFMPSYGDEPYLSQGRTLSGTWDGFRSGLRSVAESRQSDYGKDTLLWRPGSVGHESHVCPVGDDQKSVAASSANNVIVPETSPWPELYKSGRMNGSEDVKSVSSCNRCRPAVITSVQSNSIVPLTNPITSAMPRQGKGRQGGVVFLSWLLPRSKKNYKCENSIRRTATEDLGTVSIEALRNELIEAHEHRDAALMEVAEMRSSLGDLGEKLEYLETYCEDLKKALKEAMEKEFLSHLEKGSPTQGKSINSAEGGTMPVTDEVMTEGFLQVVSEARLSVKQFCKTLFSQVNGTDAGLTESLNALLCPYKLSIGSRYPKAVSYHLEAIINLSMYQDFENCEFQRNGSPKILDPHQNRQSRFAAFVYLRNLSWNEVLRKGTKYYSEEFSRFCDQKMGGIVSTLKWTKAWSETLLQAFFLAAKCMWLLHLLAFSFEKPIRILRVEEGTGFDPRYAEDVFASRQPGQCRVKVMVAPGFYVDERRVLRCKVICKYKSIT